jgi:hypothetical protein
MDFCGSSGLPSLGRQLSQGTKNGADFVACMGTHSPFEIYGGGVATSDTRYALQKCVTDLCPEVSAHIYEGLLGQIDISTLTCN